MADLIDISARLRPGMPTWPGSSGIELTNTQAFARGDDVNVSQLNMDVHCGTHVEAPLHFIDGGAPLEAFPLDVYVGPAHVLRLDSATAIGSRELSAVPSGVERLLLRTSSSGLLNRGGEEFRRDYVALTADGARWIVDHDIRLVGVDYLSVQRFEDTPETHRILMRAGVAIVEGLDLSEVAPGDYWLMCLPLRLGGAEAAPARAVLEVRR